MSEGQSYPHYHIEECGTTFKRYESRATIGSSYMLFFRVHLILVLM